MRIAHAHLAETAGEARTVRLHPEWPSAIDRHRLICAVAVEKATVHRRDAGLRKRQVLAIQITDRARISHASVEPEAHPVHRAREEAAGRDGFQGDERLAPDHLSVAIGYGQLANYAAGR